MSDRTIVLSATNLLVRGFFAVPTDRVTAQGRPAGALFAVARAIRRVKAFKEPTRLVAVMEELDGAADWPELLLAQHQPLAELLTELGIGIVRVPAGREVHTVASYARAALDSGDDVIVAGVDKRYGQLVGERVWWYDANKDVRYTSEIVEKRFGAGPEHLGDWLALVGDDSGNEKLPGVKGIGAKGALSLIEEHGSIAQAVSRSDELEGRLGKALRAAGDAVQRELARGRLDDTLPLPVAVDEFRYRAPDAAAENSLYHRLGFVELLTAEGEALAVTICERAEQLAELLAGCSSPLAVHALMEDPAPVRAPFAGIALADGAGHAGWVAADSPAWPALAEWLGDAKAAKVGHDLVGIRADLARVGIELSGIVGDSACASHLMESSNWAPHDLPIVSKHVLGRALPEEDGVRGVGKRRKAWHAVKPAKAADYAGQLADASAAIWRELAPQIEPQALLAEYLAIQGLCVRMELCGIAVDGSELDRAEAAFAEIEREIDEQIFAFAGHEFNINSSKQLGAVLFQELGLPVAGHTKTGWSTSIEALERIQHAHPIVDLVLRWRALRRLRDNWVKALRRCIDSDGRVHSRFHPARSFSGQLVNTNPDLGRVPKKTPEMARIRRAFVAEPGRLLMSVDFKQLGLHVLAHLTEDPALVEPLSRRADMHVLTAAAVFEISPEQVDEQQRQLGKVINFATFAGQGASALALQLGASAQDAKEYIARFDRHYSKVREFQDRQLELAKEQGYIVTLAGRRWPIGGLSSLDSQLRSYAERLARRATHEASVQDVSRRALLESDRALRREGLDAQPVLQILDEVLFDVPEAELDRCARVCAHAMKHAYELKVPLAVDVEAGKNWADLEPI